MPNGDGTGPTGHGPKTGRARGYCAGNDAPGYTKSGRAGRGFGRGGWGRGGRRGWRHRFHETGVTGWQRTMLGWVFEQPTEDVNAEADLLRGQLQSLERTMEVIRRRIDSLEDAREEA